LEFRIADKETGEVRESIKSYPDKRTAAIKACDIIKRQDKWFDGHTLEISIFSEE
jgi:NADH:ubiquinone oxidoreductase subunit E